MKRAILLLAAVTIAAIAAMVLFPRRPMHTADANVHRPAQNQTPSASRIDGVESASMSQASILEAAPLAPPRLAQSAMAQDNSEQELSSAPGLDASRYDHGEMQRYFTQSVLMQLGETHDQSPTLRPLTAEEYSRFREKQFNGYIARVAADEQAPALLRWAQSSPGIAPSSGSQASIGIADANGDPYAALRASGNGAGNVDTENQNSESELAVAAEPRDRSSYMNSAAQIRGKSVTPP